MIYFFDKHIKQNNNTNLESNHISTQKITVEEKQLKPIDRKQKTIRESIEEENISNFYYNFNKLKMNGKFVILILGEISGDKSKFQEALNNHLSKYNIRPNE